MISAFKRRIGRPLTTSRKNRIIKKKSGLLAGWHAGADSALLQLKRLPPPKKGGVFFGGGTFFFTASKLRKIFEFRKKAIVTIQNPDSEKFF